MRRSVFVSVLAGAAIFATRPAWGCFEIDVPLAASIRFLSTTSAEVVVYGAKVKAGGLTNGDYCAVGLGHSGSPISAVTGLTALDDDDPPSPIAELSFSPNATTTSELTALVPGTTWAGFHSVVSGSVPAATDVHLAFVVTFAAGTTYADLEDELADFGVVAGDDADGSGSLQGTSQEVEPLTAITWLPDCGNGVHDSGTGEVCEVDDDLGCSGGTVCVDCSQCVPANPAWRCKAKTLKGIAKVNRQNLGRCYAIPAKQGLPAPMGCTDMFGAQKLYLAWWLRLSMNLTPCPQFGSFPPLSYPSGNPDFFVDVIQPFYDALGTALPLGSTSAAWKCASKKFTAAAVRAVNKLRCHARAVETNTPVNPGCVTEAETKFTAAFARAEAPGACAAGNNGNGATVGALVDGYVNAVVAAIPP